MVLEIAEEETSQGNGDPEAGSEVVLNDQLGGLVG